MHFQTALMMAVSAAGTLAAVLPTTHIIDDDKTSGNVTKRDTFQFQINFYSDTNCNNYVNNWAEYTNGVDELNYNWDSYLGGIVIANAGTNGNFPNYNLFYVNNELYVRYASDICPIDESPKYDTGSGVTTGCMVVNRSNNVLKVVDDTCETTQPDYAY